MTPTQQAALDQLGAIRERDIVYRDGRSVRLGETSNASRAAWDRALLCEIVDALTDALTEQNRRGAGPETPHA